MTDTKVLLYSGGMDSEAARQLWHPDVLLYVNMHTAYSAAELARLPGGVQVADLPLTEWERPDGIIPMRNLLLVAIASNYGNRVALAATAGDRVLDKSAEFAAMASVTLSYLWRRQHWTDGKEVVVELPTKAHTKRQLVDLVAEHGDLSALAATVSCYAPVQWAGGWAECGGCKPCTRKWVAFAAAGHADLLGPWAPTARAAVAAAPLPHDRGPTELDDVVAALTNTQE